MTQGFITISINADKKALQIKITSGSTVNEALQSAQISLSKLDRVEPPIYTVLSDEAQIKVTRVREEYYIEQEIIPFEKQELANEALPEGENRLSQAGVNGLAEITYKRLFEDNIEVANTIVKTEVIKAAIPEVVMVGSNPSFTTISIPGRIAYLSAGNAWVLEDSTGHRRLIVSTGDLDGRIFSVSRDGNILLYSRFSNDENIVNSLWVAFLQTEPAKLIDLGVRNVVHYAELNPASNVVAYSTVEWRETAPGWQANNDLYEMDFSSTEVVGSQHTMLDANTGGVYGWWGMEFSWAPDGQSFLFSRPDGIGIFDTRDKSINMMREISPYQTGESWAWVPGAAWSPNGDVIYGVDHPYSESTSLDKTQDFDLIAIPTSGSSPVRLVRDVGMFAYPVPSPVQQKENFLNQLTSTNLSQATFRVAYLKAIFSDQSETSRYKLCIIDRDGSNQKCIYPADEADGLDPQHVAWSPEPMGSEADYAIAFIYNGNIWLVDASSGAVKQITGDGLTDRLDWR